MGLLAWALNKFRSQSRETWARRMVRQHRKNGHLITELLSGTPEGLLFQQIMTNTCLDCGHKGFLVGPSGGMSTNVFCANRECRSGFNFTPMWDGEGSAERIHQGNIDSYPIAPDSRLIGNNAPISGNNGNGS